MDKSKNHVTKSKNQQHSLQTYVRDHTAGAQHAIQLLEALQEAHAETPLGSFAAEQLRQVHEDLGILESLAASIGADDFQVKELAGWQTNSAD